MAIAGNPSTTSSEGLESTPTQTLFDAVPVGLLVVDGAQCVTWANRVATAIFGPCTNLAERLAAGTLDDESHDWVGGLQKAARAPGPVTFPALRFLGSDDRTCTLELTAVPLPAHRGEPVGTLIVVQDVTERAELEKRLAAAESMAAVGRLAARVAHELNNPLDGTLRYINLAARIVCAPPSDAEKAAHYLEEARQGLLRMARIVSELLEFSRSAPYIKESGNVNLVVEEAIRAMHAHADANRVAVAGGFHDEDRMPVLEDARLFQVCCNLIKNAIDAMPEGGYLTVTTGVVAGEVVIRFEDTGTGLPEDVERVFEPFYTTKPAGKGTGLGLAICREYIAQLEGRITAEHGKPKGAVFTIRIPLARDRVAE